MLAFQSLAAFAILAPSVLGFTPLYRGENRFFLDTADTAEWDALLKLGIFYGVTTNPTILERCHQPCTIENIRTLAIRALAQTDEFMCQSWGSTAQDLYETGMALSQPDRDRIGRQGTCHYDGCRSGSSIAPVWCPSLLDSLL